MGAEIELSNFPTVEVELIDENVPAHIRLDQSRQRVYNFDPRSPITVCYPNQERQKVAIMHLPNVVADYMRGQGQGTPAPSPPQYSGHDPATAYNGYEPPRPAPGYAPPAYPPPLPGAPSNYAPLPPGYAPPSPSYPPPPEPAAGPYGGPAYPAPRPAPPPPPLEDQGNPLSVRVCLPGPNQTQYAVQDEYRDVVAVVCEGQDLQILALVHRPDRPPRVQLPQDADFAVEVPSFNTRYHVRYLGMEIPRAREVLRVLFVTREEPIREP